MLDFMLVNILLEKIVPCIIFGEIYTSIWLEWKKFNYWRYMRRNLLNFSTDLNKISWFMKSTKIAQLSVNDRKFFNFNSNHYTRKMETFVCNFFLHRNSVFGISCLNSFFPSLFACITPPRTEHFVLLYPDLYLLLDFKEWRLSRWCILGL